MESAVLTDEQTIEIETRRRPEPDAGEVLLAIEHVGVCGSDVHYYDHGRIGDFVVDYPLVLGHESAGRVVETGEGVDASLDGADVAIEPGIPCRRCVYCKTGEYHLCQDMRFMATPPYDGALAEYVAWPADFVYELPATLTTRAAALCEPLSCGIHAVRTGDVGTGDTVLVTGDGPIGLFTSIAAQRAGATTTIVAGHHDEKLAVAAATGADVTVNTHDDAVRDVIESRTDGRGVDVAIDCSGADAAIQDAIAATRPGGVVVLYGLDSKLNITIDVVKHVVDEIDIRGAFRYSNTYPAAIELIQDVDVDDVIDFDEPLARTQAAFERVKSSPVVKGMITLR